VLAVNLGSPALVLATVELASAVRAGRRLGAAGARPARGGSVTARRAGWAARTCSRRTWGSPTPAGPRRGGARTGPARRRCACGRPRRGPAGGRLADRGGGNLDRWRWRGREARGCLARGPGLAELAAVALARPWSTRMPCSRSWRSTADAPARRRPRRPRPGRRDGRLADRGGGNLDRWRWRGRGRLARGPGARLGECTTKPYP
jgi:hypothetical protein